MSGHKNSGHRRSFAPIIFITALPNTEARGGGGADLSGCLVFEALLLVDLRGVRLCGVELAHWRRKALRQTFA